MEKPATELGYVNECKFHWFKGTQDLNFMNLVKILILTFFLEIKWYHGRLAR